MKRSKAAIQILYFLILCKFILLNPVYIFSQSIAEYNNEVLYHYTLLDVSVARFDEDIFDDKVDTKSLKSSFRLLKNICKYQGKIVQKIQQSSNDKYFLPAVKQFYSVVNDAINNEYQQIINLYSKPWQDSFGEEISKLANLARDKIIKAENMVIDSQKKFANDNNLNLE